MDDIALIHLRLAALERRWQRLQRGGLALLTLVGAFGVLGQAPAPSPVGVTIEAETFIVRDRLGRARAALSLGSDNRPGLALADSRGKIRAWLTLTTAETPELRFYDADEVVRTSITIDTTGTPRVQLADKAG